MTRGAGGPASHFAHQLRLKPALRLFESSPPAVSLTEPVTLNGPPKSFCSALSVRSHLSSLLEMSAPSDTLVSVGRKLKRSAGCWPSHALGRSRSAANWSSKGRSAMSVRRRRRRAQRGAELGLILRRVDPRLDRRLVPAERRLHARRGDGSPGDAGRLIGHGQQLLGLIYLKQAISRS